MLCTSFFKNAATCNSSGALTWCAERSRSSWHGNSSSSPYYSPNSSTTFLNKATKRCVSACPSGTYGKGELSWHSIGLQADWLPLDSPCPTDKVCSSCSARYIGSSTCSATAATGCRSPFFLNGAQCKPTCPAGTFGSTGEWLSPRRSNSELT